MVARKNTEEKGLALHWQTLLAMVLGAGVGLAAGPSIASIGKLGGALIQVIKALATPLLFFALLDSFLNVRIRGRSLVLLLAICAINGLAAIAIGMSFSTIFQPGHHIQRAIPAGIDLPKLEKLDLWSGLLGHVPQSIFSPFINSSVPGVIILAVLFGLALRTLKDEGHPMQGVQKVLDFINLWLFRTIGWVVKASPIAVFAVVAQSVGERGLSPLIGLGVYVLVAVGGMATQVVVVYQLWIRVFAGISLRKFWKQAERPIAHSFGVNSSLATLPMTFQTLQNLGISNTAARLGAGLGTNFNNDGILLYEAMAVLVIAQAYGLDLSLGAQIMLALTCVITAFGVAGVPDAGLIGLTLVMGSAGLPVEILPLLYTVDWLIGRFRSATNVLGDLTVSIALDRFKVET